MDVDIKDKSTGISHSEMVSNESNWMSYKKGICTKCASQQDVQGMVENDPVSVWQKGSDLVSETVMMKTETKAEMTWMLSV